MKIQLSEHFTLKKLLKFVFPSIVMMIFTSVYGVVDGIFVSNFVGKIPFAAVNLIMPFLMILGALGFMIGTGGSAIISKTLGEGDKEKGKSIFLYADLCNYSFGSGFDSFRLNFYATYLNTSWSKWRNARKLCSIWQFDYNCFNSLYAS